MAALFHMSPHFLSLPSHFFQTTSSFSNLHHYQSFIYSNRNFCLASTRKSRPSRKLMNDDELCNVLREFVSSVGLPQGHVPSTKELSHHGRKDLANIVRRRGHKLIKELLTNSAETATEGFDSLSNIDGDPNENSDHEKAGQDGKLNNVVEEATDTASMDNDSTTTGTNIVAKDDSTFVSNDESLVSKEPPMSMQEKVESFMKYGQLDAVEDDMCGDYKLNDGSKNSNLGQNLIEGELVVRNEGDDGHLAHYTNNFKAQNGTLLLPRLLDPSTVEDKYKRDLYPSAQGSQNADLNNNMHTETGKMDNEVEIHHLKQMLHQKELELSRLKEDIEREKEALSILQAKAENEINKAQKLISEKDAELNAAEESLSGLVEAKIQYSGEGKMVEVAGSFNGWHQRIKMDPQPSSAKLDPVGSRKVRLWSTTLWLYPGSYEIKFIVDGQWKIDPQKESTMKGGIENNIFRVDR